MKKIALVIPLGQGKEIEFKSDIKSQSNLIRIIPVIGKNPSKNRNIGAKKSKEPLIAFINGHTRLSSNWSKKVIEFSSKNRSVDIFGGPQLTSDNESFFSKVSGVALESKFGSANVSKRYKRLGKLSDGNEYNLTSANLICKKEVFNKLKFDENIYPGEDPKFLREAKKLGFKIIYTPDIIVYNSRRTTFKDLSGQIFSYGKTRAMSESLSVVLRKPFFTIPPLFLIYLLCLPTLFFINKLFFIPLLAYLSLNILSSIYEGFKSKIKYIFLLPLIFLTVHLSYGAGFIYGKFSK